MLGFNLVTIRCQKVAFPNIQAVLFDKDGTLANSEVFLRNLAQCRSRLIDAQVPGVQEPLLMAFGVAGDRLNPAGLMAVGSRLENEIAAAAYVAETGCNWTDALQIARSAFDEADRNLFKAAQTPIILGSRELLQTLSQMNIKVGILSSDSNANVCSFVEHYHLQSWISSYVGVDGYPNKSAPALMQKILTDLSVSATETLMIGDATIDMQIAHDNRLAGCIGFAGGWNTEIQLEQADVVITAFEEIEVLP